MNKHSNRSGRFSIARISALLWMLCALTAPSFAQSGVRQVKAILSSGVAKLGDRVQVTVVAQDVNEARILELPDIEGLRF